MTSFPFGMQADFVTVHVGIPGIQGLFDELWESSFQGGHCLFEWEHHFFPSCIRFPSRQKNIPTRNDNIPQEKNVKSFPLLHRGN